MIVTKMRESRIRNKTMVEKIKNIILLYSESGIVR